MTDFFLGVVFALSIIIALVGFVFVVQSEVRAYFHNRSTQK